MKFSYYGHSCFGVEIAGKQILFDPFVTGNPLAAAVDVDSIPADVIFVSHGHVDHILDLERIARRTDALVVANWEIHEWLQKKGLTRTHPMNMGGKWDFGFAVVKAVVAHHSSGLPDGSYGGSPMGFVFKTAEGNFYYSGDTALTLDMQLVPSFAVPGFSVLPIGDNFTMDVADAARAAQYINCRRVVGVHYDSFGYIKIDKEAAQDYFSRHGLELILPEIGATIEV